MRVMNTYEEWWNDIEDREREEDCQDEEYQRDVEHRAAVHDATAEPDAVRATDGHDRWQRHPRDGTCRGRGLGDPVEREVSDATDGNDRQQQLRGRWQATRRGR